MEKRIDIVRPTMEALPQFLDAVHRGWSPNNERPEEARKEILEAVEKDAAEYVERQYDREAKGPLVKLPDGSFVPRLPGYVLWIWDGEFCGIVGLRWQPGTEALPPYVLGHIGYSVVPWKQRRGYAAQALALMLGNARREGLAYVHITTNPDNVASQGVIAKNGGVLVERFIRPPQQGGTESLRYRIDLGSDPEFRAGENGV